MDLRTFLIHAKEPDFFFEQSLIYFLNPSYHLLFFSLLMQSIKKTLKEKYTIIDIQQIDLEQFKAQISVQFLGQRHFYWCGNINQLEAKKQKNFVTVIQNYKGPHVIGFFSEKAVHGQQKNELSVELPKELTNEDIKVLYEYFFPLLKALPDQSIMTIIKRTGSLDLEVWCLLFHYISLLSSAQINNFIAEWFDKLVISDKSLFMLSTYLFARKSKSFLELWHAVESDYPMQFWLSFWSDQLFRATCFIRCAQNNKFLDAKKIAYRLPFTFIKKDWRNFSPRTLTDAHHFLYQYDYSIKNGGDEVWLDLFYQKFFNKKM
jgi:hypothetical protein